eukprot:6175335-Pleurochrysis_carterae.AAC.2
MSSPAPAQQFLTGGGAGAALAATWRVIRAETRAFPPQTVAIGPAPLHPVDSLSLDMRSGERQISARPESGRLGRGRGYAASTAGIP